MSAAPALPVGVGVALRRAGHTAVSCEPLSAGPIGTTLGAMCRNITELRGLEPAATAEEIEAAARQYVRKVSGIQKLSDATREPFEQAVAEVTATTARLLAALPERRQPPATIPPLRRPEVQARIAARG